MTSRQAIVIAMDGVGAMPLGPYGNATAATPTWNRLAAHSLLIEFALAESVQLQQLYNAYWYGSPAYQARAADASPLASIYGGQGHTTRLITDDTSILSHSGSNAFHEAELIDVPTTETAAESMEETQLVQFAWQAIDGITAHDGLTWIHSRGLTGPWDAPWELRQNYVDDEDPDAPTFVAPPREHLPVDPDPDVIWGINHAYAAQLSVADMALGVLLDGIAAKAPNALVVMTAPRGYALGAHRFVGYGGSPLFSDQLHVPLFIKPPGESPAGVRIPAIVATHRLHELLCQWCQPESYGDFPSLLQWMTHWHPHEEDFAMAADAHERTLRTPQWFLREVTDRDTATKTFELYAKPDDRWEQNEVASRCPDEVRELQKVVDRAAIES